MKSLDLVQKMRGLCETENGTKIDALLQPELIGFKGRRSLGPVRVLPRDLRPKKKPTSGFPSSLPTSGREEAYLVAPVFSDCGCCVVFLSRSWRFVGQDRAEKVLADATTNGVELHVPKPMSGRVGDADDAAPTSQQRAAGETQTSD